MIIVALLFPNRSRSDHNNLLPLKQTMQPGLVKTSTLVMFTPLATNEYTQAVDLDSLSDDSDLIQTGLPTFNADRHFTKEDIPSQPTRFTTTLTKSYLPNGMKMLNQYIKKRVLGSGSFGTTVLVEDSKSKRRYVCFLYSFTISFSFVLSPLLTGYEKAKQRNTGKTTDRNRICVNCPPPRNSHYGSTFSSLFDSSS